MVTFFFLGGGQTGGTIEPMTRYFCLIKEPQFLKFKHLGLYICALDFVKVYYGRACNESQFGFRNIKSCNYVKNTFFTLSSKFCKLRRYCAQLVFSWCLPILIKSDEIMVNFELNQIESFGNKIMCNLYTKIEYTRIYILYF